MLSAADEEAARAEEALVGARLRLLSVRGDLSAWGGPPRASRWRGTRRGLGECAQRTRNRGPSEWL